MVLHKMNIYVSFCSCPSISSNSRSRTEAMITLNIFTLLMMVPVYFPKMFQSLPPTIFGVFVDPHSWQYWLPPIILQFSITKERARLKLKENKKEGKEGGCEISCFAFSFSTRKINFLHYSFAYFFKKKNWLYFWLFVFNGKPIIAP